jgi:fatty-acyl-CoA synthase
MIRSTMQRVPLSLNQILERAGKLYPDSEIVSRLPDKSLVRHRFADFHRRARALASAFLARGLNKGDRVATLSWNHYAHLECYFGIPAAGGVIHTLNLRLAPDEIAWIAGHAQDRFLIVDDVLLPLYEKFRDKAPFEQVIVVPLTGAPVAAPFLDYEATLRAAPERFDYAPHGGERPLACVVLRKGRSTTADELRMHLAGAFAKWQLPERFAFLDALPRTSTGKFWKAKLRERFRR